MWVATDTQEKTATAHLCTPRLTAYVIQLRLLVRLFHLFTLSPSLCHL